MLQDMMTYGQHMMLVAFTTTAGWMAAEHKAAINVEWLGLWLL